MLRYINRLLSIFILIFMVPTAQAAYFSHSGILEEAYDVQLIHFSIEQRAVATMKTLSYAGGTNAANDLIVAGGFDPVLSLFDGNGKFITTNDDWLPSDRLDNTALAMPVGIDPISGKSHDALLTLELSPGDYTLAISQWQNFFQGIYNHSGSNEIEDPLSMGFLQEGNPHFQNYFSDLYNNQRTGFWAVDLHLEDYQTSPVPLPSSILLLGPVLTMVLGGRKKFTLRR